MTGTCAATIGGFSHLVPLASDSLGLALRQRSRVGHAALANQGRRFLRSACALFLSFLVFGADSPKRILILGDSLTAGLGVSEQQAFPALLQKKLEIRKLDWQIMSAGVSGDTSAGGLRRLAWVLRQPIDIFILELGANDGLRGVALAETENNLQTIIDQVRDKYPKVKILIAGMRLPPNLGDDYTKGFEAIFSKLAKRNKSALLPFLLEGVAGNPKLNQPDGIHPTPEGHAIIADSLWRQLEPLLR